MAQHLTTTVRFVSDADLVELLWMVRDDAEAVRLVRAEIAERSSEA